MVGRRIAQRIEETRAAVHVPPALRMHAARVGAQVEKLGPLVGVDRGWVGRAHDVRLPA